MAVSAALRRDYLAALGLEPLVLHVPAACNTEAHVGADADDHAANPNTASAAHMPDPAHRRAPPGAVPEPMDTGLFAPRPARLCLCVAEPDVFAGADAALLRAILRTLGLGEADVIIRSQPDHDARLPVLSFGPAVPATVQAPALAQLRNARAKRALWPALRRLRIQLRSPA